jgi:hypothetical protein
MGNAGIDRITTWGLMPPYPKNTIERRRPSNGRPLRRIRVQLFERDS